MNTFRRAATVGAALVVLAPAACSFMGDVRAVSALQTALATRYGETTYPGLANGKLTITFENSKFAALEGPSRSDFARGVAVFAFTQYARRDSISSIGIAFKSVKRAAGFTLTNRDAPYSWTAAELRAAADSVGSNAGKADTAVSGSDEHRKSGGT